MPPKQKVDLDLDALAPPNQTLRLRGKVYELPGDIPIASIVRALQLRDRLGAATEDDSEDDTVAALDELIEIIYDLFRQCDPEFEPMPLTLGNIMNILGFVLSGMDIDLDAAVGGTLAGEAELTGENGDSPPTSRKPRTVTARTNTASARRSQGRSSR